MIRTKKMNKMLAALFAASLFFAPLALTSCDHSPEDEEETTENAVTITLKGNQIINFLGKTGSKNSDGDVEITPDGWNTTVDLSSPLTVANTKSITVNGMTSNNSNCHAGINFTNGGGDTVSAYLNETSLTDATVDMSSCTAETLTKAQLWLVGSDWDSAMPDENITIHSITIVTTDSSFSVSDEGNYEASTVTIIAASAQIEVGSTITLVATVSPSKKTVTWESSNTDVATVDSNGVVTGVAVGTTKITQPRHHQDSRGNK